MIRLILTGGLGNQMFEYAAAKALALRLQQNLTLDLYALNKQTGGTKRQLELDVFNLDLNISTNWKTKFLVKAFPIVDKNRSFFRKIFGYFRDYSAIVFLPEFNTLSGNIILHGHFQNEKYFEQYQDEIRKDFTFKAPLTGKNHDTEQRIRNSESVAIHIRRGDYITNMQAQSNFAVCDKSYYEKAIADIVEKIKAPHFFIFSEDFDWVKENINFGNNAVSFIDWNRGKDSYIDLQLMSFCKHNIIANSSFSWWAAWLNSNRDKLVYAPAKWFVKENRNKDLINFYPSSWTIV